jgi:SAM-dependent methyltransferase
MRARLTRNSMDGLAPTMSQSIVPASPPLGPVSSPPALQPLLAAEIRFAAEDTDKYIHATGLSGPERQNERLAGRWTDGHLATVAFLLPHYVYDNIIIKLDMQPFLSGDALPEQIVTIQVNGMPAVSWTLVDPLPRRRAILVERSQIPASNLIQLTFKLPNCVSPFSLELNDDKRCLGIKLQRLSWELAKVKQPPDALLWQLGRPVGGEARKTFDQKIESGFWSRFATGPYVLDIGYKGYTAVRGVVPILEGAIGVDLDYPGYDGRRLPFNDQSQDAVFSSHCLEHIPDYINAIQEWHRVTKVGGHIITIVPSAHLYERARRPPSARNNTHIRFYTPSSLLDEFETALLPNSYRVRHLCENDQGYSYETEPDVHPTGCYEIELVVEKIQPPSWKMAD